MPEWWRDYRLYHALEVLTSSKLVLFRKGVFRWARAKFINDRRVFVLCGFADNSFMELIAFQARVFPPRELGIPDLSRHDACKRAWTCGDILFLLPQHVQEFVGDIKLLNIVRGMQFELVLCLLALWCS